MEVAEQTDPSWGRFAGYVDEEGSKGIDVWDASGFVNSNTKHSFEVAKEMEVPTDETFTMILEQITSATASPVSTKDEIRETVPGSGIGYTVYDSETNEEIALPVEKDEGKEPKHDCYVHKAKGCNVSRTICGYSGMCWP